jgi:decaprenyl-phosphate phosphoribosyltransferase
VSAARPRQWVKNSLVVIAPAAAGVLFQREVMFHTAIAFVAFCLTASGVYLLNDVVDVEADRSHPEKRHRAIASGELSVSVAVTAAILLIAGGVAVALAAAGYGLIIVLAIYAINSIAYVAYVKRLAVIELASVAAGFFLRALAGATANHLYVSSWFLVVISFGALFLVVGKRSAERHRLGDGAGTHRPVLDEYSESFLNSALTLTSTVVVTTYCLWAFDTSRSGLSNVRHDATAIQLTVVPVVLALLYILRTLQSGGGGAPEELVLSDRTIQVLGASWAILLLIGIY